MYGWNHHFSGFPGSVRVYRYCWVVVVVVFSTGVNRLLPSGGGWLGAVRQQRQRQRPCRRG
jgi:hypothetical protein